MLKYLIKKRILIVFPNNKLISIDTILPVIFLAYKKIKNLKIYFYFFSEEHYESIKKNTVMWELITEIGVPILFCQKNNGFFNKLSHRLLKWLSLLWVVLRGYVVRSYYFHAGVMNSYPIRFLYWFNKKRTYYFHTSAWKYPKYFYLIGNITKVRQSYSGRYAAGALIGFDPQWELFLDPKLQGIPHYCMSPSRTIRTWLSEINKRSDVWFKSEFESSGFDEGNEIIVLILSCFLEIDFLRGPDVLRDVFKESMDVLTKYSGDIPIFIKPHAITEMQILKELLSSYSNSRIIITGLHPNVLATRAKFFIANMYSTVFSDAIAMGVPTIEYADYSDDALAITDGGSMAPGRVTYFINRNLSRLEEVVSQLLNDSNNSKLDPVINDDPNIAEWLK